MTRRSHALVAAALAALLVTGIGLANRGRGTATTDSVSATFTATASAQSSSRTCAGRDGTYRITRGVYAGLSTGSLPLTGTVVVRTKSVVNAATGHGWTAGTLVVRAPVSGKLKAKVNMIAVDTKDGALEGFLLGRTLGPSAKLLANFSATFGSSGTLAGTLGGSAADNPAVVFAGACDQGAPAGKATVRSSTPATPSEGRLPRGALLVPRVVRTERVAAS